ncbi:sorting nexin-24-like [Acipenser oxyrinchus oxyrinchus]|uniref:Sorting nexin-24-like n=1 Tax=Acipenser oxyrinchus oxyrinchus TaxID=40147 RepID=A0AAD8FZW1_ACIOX|nr:sorting nexin-24-like [Acipenser oxyrinchus oxyrinchus]
MIEVFIPSLENSAVEGSGKTRTVFRVEVLFNGRKHFVSKRYSEFHALHKKLKKILHTPDFPSKRNPNLRQKPSHQRRQELEDYVQYVLRFNKEVPKEILDFLHVKHFHSVNTSCSLESLNDSHSEDYSCRLLHQRGVVGFSKDPYMLEESSDFLPNVIVDGVLQGLYPRDIRVSFTPCTKSWPPTKTEPAASPEASPS